MNKVSVNCMTSIKTDLFECLHGVSECFVLLMHSQHRWGCRQPAELLCVLIHVNNRQQSAVRRSSRKREREREKAHFVKILIPLSRLYNLHLADGVNGRSCEARRSLRGELALVDDHLSGLTPITDPCQRADKKETSNLYS